MQLTPFAKRLIIFLAFVLLGWLTGPVGWGTLLGLVIAYLTPARWLGKEPISSQEQKRRQRIREISTLSRGVSPIGPESLIRDILEVMVTARVTYGIEKEILDRIERCGRQAIDLTRLLHSSSDFGGSHLQIAFQSIVRKRFGQTVHHYMELPDTHKEELKEKMLKVLEEICGAFEKIEKRANNKQLDARQDHLINARVFVDMERALIATR